MHHTAKAYKIPHAMRGPASATCPACKQTVYCYGVQGKVYIQSHGKPNPHHTHRCDASDTEINEERTTLALSF